MSDATQDTGQLQQKLAELLTQLQNQPAAPAISGWRYVAQAPAGVNIQGVAVPIRVGTPIGPVRCYVTLGPECAANPTVLDQAIGQLHAAGLPVDAFRDSGRSGWEGGNSWSGGYRRGGYYGGGYRR